MERGDHSVSEEESFIGLTLEWNFWEWGRKYNEAQAARARARGAALQHAEATELIQLQVQQKRQELQCAGARQRVAEIAVSQAEENLRLKQLRFAENLATSLEVLDAQTLLTKAHSDRIQARFEVLVGQAALRLAMDRIPAAVKGAKANEHEDGMGHIAGGFSAGVVRLRRPGAGHDIDRPDGRGGDRRGLEDTGPDQGTARGRGRPGGGGTSAGGDHQR
jgi:hypothetical protein